MSTVRKSAAQVREDKLVELAVWHRLYSIVLWSAFSQSVNASLGTGRLPRNSEGVEEYMADPRAIKNEVEKLAANKSFPGGRCDEFVKFVAILGSGTANFLAEIALILKEKGHISLGELNALEQRYSIAIS